MYQKTLVRYELNKWKYEVDDPTDDFYDKWEFPCYLGVDDDNNFIWYNSTFQALVENKKIHRLFFIENYPNSQLINQQLEKDIYQIIFNLMDLGLVVKNENGKTYKYVFETYKFEQLIIKEILGIDVDSFQMLEDEQFRFLENKLGDIWKKENNLYQKNKDYFIDFETLFKNRW